MSTPPLSDNDKAQLKWVENFRFGEIKPGQTTHMREVEIPPRSDDADELEIIVQSELDTEPFTLGNQVHVTCPISHLEAVREVVKVGLEHLRDRSGGRQA